MPRFWEAPGSPPCCSAPAAPGSTAWRNTWRCGTCCAVATPWPRWRAAGAVEREPELPLLRALAQHHPLRHQHVPARVTFEALPRGPAADFPTRRVVTARRAAHVHALAFEV